MIKYIMAEQNCRSITGEDKIFGINNLAKEMIAREGKEKVANATIGALLDEEGNLAVLSSVVDVLRNLKPEEYAEYAPIAGVPAYLESIKKATFGNYQPKCFVEAVASPGGTGAIRNAIQNYTRKGDRILTSDWYWSPYSTITQELGRSLETYPLFDGNFQFNHAAFDAKVKDMMESQERVFIIINTPAHNPTGYTFTLEDWDKVIETVTEAAGKDKKAVILADVAYLDFAGDSDKYREFFPKLEGLPENILPLVAYSLSKSFTMYGMRAGALLCMAPTREIAEEFKAVAAFSSRGSWSNCNRSAMVTLTNIFADEELKAKVDQERIDTRAILLNRGRIFTEAAERANLTICPYDSGFFITVPCLNADDVGKELQKDGIFAVPIGRGIRISIASISREQCAMIPEKMAAAIQKING